MNNNGMIDSLERLFLVVTNHCQAKCRLCGYWKSKPREFLSLSVVEEKVIPIIKKYNVGLTLITGGEPTLHPQLAGIIAVLEAAGTQQALITNGMRLDRVYESIKDRVDAYLFSLDAANEVLYREIRGLDNFDELIAWPGKIVAHRPYVQVAINCVLQKKNVGDLVNLYRLVKELPVEGIFFNVPEMKPYCFGRGKVVPAEVWKNVVLEEGEISILEENLKKLVELDRGRGKLLQGRNFFERCVRYFRGLVQPGGIELNDPREVCRVPFTSMVVEENQGCRPCFYLPNSEHTPSLPAVTGTPIESFSGVQGAVFQKSPLAAGGIKPTVLAPRGDPVNGEELRKARKEFLTDMELRRKYCSFCLQFQG